MNLWAIDPGPTESALVIVNASLMQTHPGAPPVLMHLIDDNLKILRRLEAHSDYDDSLVLEMIQGMGMAVGRSTFETVFWIGRFAQAWNGPHRRIYRTTIKGHVCGSTRAKDPNVRQALIDRYPATGGGKTPQVGIKNQPGPLFGMASHKWSALAVAITAMETHGEIEGEKK